MTVNHHVDDESLADYLEDLLSPDDHATVTAHLSYCGDCAARHDNHTALRTLLHQAGSETEPMPPDVANRLDAVLTAEARSRGGSDRVTQITKPRHRHRGRRRTGGPVKLLAAAAAVLALVGGGVATYSLIGSGSPSLIAGGHQPPTHPSRSASPTNRPTTFGFKTGGAEPDLSAAKFGTQVKALVVPVTGKTSKGKPFGTEQEPGIAGSSQHCVEQVLGKAHAGAVLDSRQAQLDGKLVSLALTRTATAGVVRAYAVSGCPGINAHVVQQADVDTG